MNSNLYESKSTTDAMSDLSASDKHCLFRSGPSWFSVPAISVREISISPELVRVPDCHPALAGLCHLRSEFIPVLLLNSLLDIDTLVHSQPHNKLVVINGQGGWALLIAEAAALESLETLVTPEARSDDLNQSAIMGTSMYRGQVVRVLDPTRVYQLAQRVLEQFWQRSQASLYSSRQVLGSAC